MTVYFVGPNNSWVTSDDDEFVAPEGFTSADQATWETQRDAHEAAKQAAESDAISKIESHRAATKAWLVSQGAPAELIDALGGN